VVDGADTDTETRRTVAVDLDVCGEAVVFLIASDVGELWKLPKRGHDARRPRRQQRTVGRLQRELILRAADRAIERQVLQRLQIDRDSGDAGGLVLDAARDVGRARRALPF